MSDSRLTPRRSPLEAIFSGEAEESSSRPEDATLEGLGREVWRLSDELAEAARIIASKGDLISAIEFYRSAKSAGLLEAKSEMEKHYLPPLSASGGPPRPMTLEEATRRILRLERRVFEE